MTGKMRTMLTQGSRSLAALLLEHFQTKGVHEGRQGSESFNVAAYMEHCGKDLEDAFGGSCECCCFYYMLHQSTEKSAAAAEAGRQRQDA